MINLHYFLTFEILILLNVEEIKIKNVTGNDQKHTTDNFLIIDKILVTAASIKSNKTTKDTLTTSEHGSKTRYS